MNITTLIQLFSIHMTSIQPQSSARHPKASFRHPQTLSRHYPDTPNIAVFAYERALEEKAIADPNYSYSTLFNLYDNYDTPDICQTHLDIIQTPQTLSRHPGYRCFRVRGGTGTSTEDCPLEVPVPSWTRKHLYLWCLDNVWCVWIMSKGVWQMSGGDIDH